jgi:hypothetical protein
MNWRKLFGLGPSRAEREAAERERQEFEDTAEHYECVITPNDWENARREEQEERDRVREQEDWKRTYEAEQAEKERARMKLLLSPREGYVSYIRPEDITSSPEQVEKACEEGAAAWRILMERRAVATEKAAKSLHAEVERRLYPGKPGRKRAKASEETE